MPASHPPSTVLIAALHWTTAGHRVALLTLADIQGTSPRPLGAQMVVRDDGEHQGKLSSGCVEHTLIDHATALLKGDHTVQSVVLGTGGQYLDLALPCGSRITVDIRCDPPVEQLQRAEQYQRRRALHYWQGSATTARCTATPTFNSETIESIDLENSGGESLNTHRLNAKGLSAAAQQADNQADNRGATVSLYAPPLQAFVFGDSSDDLMQQVCGHLQLAGAVVHGLQQPPNTLQIDRFTAVITLWHDVERELPILRWALTHSGLYIGCLGSRASHKARITALTPWAEQQHIDLQQRLTAPAGAALISKEPPHVAMAIAMEVITAYQRQIDALQPAR